MKTNQFKKQKGFTLIELMIVVGIIGVLSAIAVPAYQSYLLKTEANTAVSIPRTLLTNIDLFIQEKGKFPSDSDFSEIGGAANMSAMGTLALSASSDTTKKEEGTLVFTVGANASLNGKNVTFTRTASGWNCSHNTEQTVKGCAGATGSTGSASSAPAN